MNVAGWYITDACSSWGSHSVHADKERTGRQLNFEIETVNLTAENSFDRSRTLVYKLANCRQTRTQTGSCSLGTESEHSISILQSQTLIRRDRLKELTRARYGGVNALQTSRRSTVEHGFSTFQRKGKFVKPISPRLNHLNLRLMWHFDPFLILRRNGLRVSLQS